MIGLVVASHGKLAAELVATARQIVGDFSQVETCSVAPGTAPEDLRGMLRRAIDAVEGGQGVLIFADLIGGSPCMQSLSLCQDLRIEVLTGVNLPMLLKALSSRMSVERSLVDLAAELTQYGQRNITCATAALRTRLTEG